MPEVTPGGISEGSRKKLFKKSQKEHREESQKNLLKITRLDESRKELLEETRKKFRKLFLEVSPKTTFRKNLEETHWEMP